MLEFEVLAFAALGALTRLGDFLRRQVLIAEIDIFSNSSRA